MSDAATERAELWRLGVIEGPTAVGANKLRWFAHALPLVLKVLVEQHEFIAHDEISVGLVEWVPRLLGDQPGDQLGQLVNWQDQLGSSGTDHAVRHPRIGRLLRILDGDDTTSLGNRLCAGGAVIKSAGEDQRYNPGSVGERRAAEERIRRWPVPVLAWTVPKPDLPLLDEQVPVRRCDIDPARLHRLRVHRMGCWNGAQPVEDLRQDASAAWRDMHDDEDGRLEIGREQTHQPTQRFDAASRCGYDDDVSPLVQFHQAALALRECNHSLIPLCHPSVELASPGFDVSRPDDAGDTRRSCLRSGSAELPTTSRCGRGHGYR